LEAQSFEGNRAEARTAIEVLGAFKERHGLDEITVTADAAMLSSANILTLEDMGYHYIIGSRIAKCPYEAAEFMGQPGAVLADGQVFESFVPINTGKGTGSRKEIDYGLLDEARRKAGIKGYVTDLSIPAAEVIISYHALFDVERSFRMSKSDLRARPIFHHKRDSIEAHLTIVFAALAIARRIQATTGLSIKKFVQRLSVLRTGLVVVNGSRHEIQPRIPEDVVAQLERLGSRECGH